MKKCIVVIIALISIFLIFNFTFAATPILYGSFIGGGIWKWDGSSWSQVTPNNPEAMATSGENLYGSFIGGGIWKYDGSNWTQVTPNTPQLMVASDTILYGSFIGGGIWQWGSSSWTQVTPNTPKLMVALGENLYGAFAGAGIWKWDGSTWTQMTPTNPELIVATGTTLYGTFTGAGIWKWNYGATWTQITPNTPQLMVASGENLYGSFIGGGIWKYDGSSWTQVTPNNPEIMTASDIELYGSFTGAGIWKWDGSSWTQVTPNNPTIMAAADLSYLYGKWTWVSGSNTVKQAGSYGTKGVAAAGNVPGARFFAVSWIDSSDNFWLFGGLGYDSVGDYYYLNDLWKFDGTNWTWVSGSNTVRQDGIYGTKGVAAEDNVPGGHSFSVSWIDSSGNLWLFGGINGSYLNDLWKFDGTYWTWVSGSDTSNQAGIYGTKGVAAEDNVPGARYGAVSWIDSSDNLWLFGGTGYDSAHSFGRLNDLWKFDGTNWTWVSGSNTINQAGSYGTKGVAAEDNVPGARYGAVSWIDSSGNFWLFGGGNGVGELNDLWKFDGANWTWVSGSNTVRQAGIYGTKGVAAEDNVPGARYGAVSWIDSSVNFWLFGGAGYDSASDYYYLNDLWKFDGTNWTWVNGSNIISQYGSYGIKGVAAVGNVPGARRSSVSWIDSSGNFWLFGGTGYDSAGNDNRLNDLWRYQP